MPRTKTTSKLNIRPTAGNVLLEPQEAVRQTPSGIVLPESAEEKPQKGKVLAVGDPDTTDSGAKKPAPCKVGNTVYYKKWGGNEIKIDGKEYLFVRFEDILAVETTA
ncbi:co-chaperone GroES [Candidatus Microgenomates bacterium]|nr:co-chaperone GroES [Candidatus Microgenomates bacterium]